MKNKDITKYIIFILVFAGLIFESALHLEGYWQIGAICFFSFCILAIIYRGYKKSKSLKARELTSIKLKR